jgi:hypothetical protein
MQGSLSKDFRIYGTSTNHVVKYIRYILEFRSPLRNLESLRPMILKLKN